MKNTIAALLLITTTPAFAICNVSVSSKKDYRALKKDLNIATLLDAKGYALVKPRRADVIVSLHTDIALVPDVRRPIADSGNNFHRVLRICPSWDRSKANRFVQYCPDVQVSAFATDTTGKITTLIPSQVQPSDLGHFGPSFYEVLSLLPQCGQ